jgi:RNA polymerase sigma factor (sigma-70 family)
MLPAAPASTELSILRVRAEGKLSTEEAFEQLYELHARTLLAWLAFRAPFTDAEDLAQDVWQIFYRWWRDWKFLPEMDSPEARPVLSFLFRTCHFVLQGYRRRGARAEEPLDEREAADGLRSPERMLQEVQVGQCLTLARRICPPSEQDLLLAKLAGVPAREIAATLRLTEAAVDHQFRNAIARLQKEMLPQGPVERRKNG